MAEPTRDAEIDAIQVILSALIPFDLAARERVLNFARDWARDPQNQDDGTTERAAKDQR